MHFEQADIAATLRRLALAAIAACLIAMSHATAGNAEDRDPIGSTEISREHLIQAMILYNFAKFTEWPADAFKEPRAPLRMCVLGTDPLGAALNSIHGKRIRSRVLVTNRIGKVKDAAQCHMLFISASERDRLDSILDAIAEQPILTVADMPRFARTGGIIALKVVDNRFRLEINTGVADKAGLKLSSKLLRLAETVRTQTAQSTLGP